MKIKLISLRGFLYLVLFPLSVFTGCTDTLQKEHIDLVNKKQVIETEWDTWEKTNKEVKNQYESTVSNLKSLGVKELSEVNGKTKLLLYELTELETKMDSFNVTLKKHKLKHGCK